MEDNNELIRYDEPDENGDVYKKGCFGDSVKKIAIVGMGNGMTCGQGKSMAHTIALKNLMLAHPDLKIAVSKEMGEQLNLGIHANVIMVDEALSLAKDIEVEKPKEFVLNRHILKGRLKTGKEKRKEKRKKNGKKKNRRY